MSARIAALSAALAVTSALPVGAAGYKVLAFFGVGGYAHGSRPVANLFLDSLARTMDFELIKSEDPSVFTAENLAGVKVVILNNNTAMGKILNVDQRSALMAFLRTKGAVAWHASSDQGGTWPEYVGFLGAEFKSHGAAIGTIRRDSAAGSHPVGAGLADTARFDEEWYAFKANPRASPGIKVLYALDEASCKIPCSEPMGDHPVVWARSEPTGGRLLYAAMGHFDHVFQKTAYTKALFRQSIEWAVQAGSAPIRPLLPGKVSGTEWFLARTGAGMGFGAAGPGAMRVLTVDGRTVRLMP